SISKLVEAYSLIQTLEDSYWKEVKLEEITEIIASAAGLYLEALAATPTSSPSEEIEVELEAINRSNVSFSLVSVELEPNNSSLETNQVLENNRPWKKKLLLKLPENTGITTPYWLYNKGGLGLYEVEDQRNIGLPETPAKAKAKFIFKINGVEIPFIRSVVYKYNDPRSEERRVGKESRVRWWSNSE